MRYLLFIICFSLVNAAFSQQKFIQAGTITYERKLGQISLLESINEGEDNMFMEELKKAMPRQVTDIYKLEFNGQAALYRLEKENAENKYVMSNLRPIEDAYTIQDFSAQMLTMKTAVFDKKYLIKDSLTKYQWKITGEVRQIAGFDCKKAITKICDSVVVVAFYNDEILVKGGPESFNGLPGMIMGIAIPRLSLTLFATKIELNNGGTPLVIPVEKKPNYIPRKAVLGEVAAGTKQWGKQSNVLQWIVSM